MLPEDDERVSREARTFLERIIVKGREGSHCRVCRFPIEDHLVGVDEGATGGAQSCVEQHRRLWMSQVDCSMWTTTSNEGGRIDTSKR